MEKEVEIKNDDNSSIEYPVTRDFKDEDSSDDEESYKSCTYPSSGTSFSQLPGEGLENKNLGDQPPNPEHTTLSFPPDISDDSADTFSENGSDDIYYSEIENMDNGNDTDISNPGQEENSSANPEAIDISFQRELLNYLWSFFSADSRSRFRENRQSTVTVSEEQLEEYKKLRAKVNSNMKVLGVGSSRDLASSDQNIAKNLYYLLAARERGDWTSCRRYSRVVPMWSFEKRESQPVAQLINEEDQTEDGDMEEDMVQEEDNEDWSENDSLSSKTDTVVMEEQPDDHHVTKRLVFINTQPVRYLSDKENKNAKPSTGATRGFDENRETSLREENESYRRTEKWRRVTKEQSSRNYRKKGMGSPLSKDGIRFQTNQHERGQSSGRILQSEVVSCESVHRNGIWDIKSAVSSSRWSVLRLGLETRFNAHDGCVNALDFTSNGDWIASGSDDKHIVITDWQRQKQLARFTVGHVSNLFQVRFLPGSNDLELVTCSRDWAVRYAALSSTGQLQYSRLLTRHQDCCHKLDVPIDQQSLVMSIGEDTRVLASDVRAPRTLGEICTVDKVPLYSISCSPMRSQEFAVAGKDSRVFIFDRRRPSGALQELCPEILNHKPRSNYHVTSVVYSKDGNSLLASYNDDDIYLLSTTTTSADNPVAIHRYQGHRNVQTVTGVAFYGPQDEYVVSGSNDGHVLLWERDSEALVNWFRADENGVVNVLKQHPTMPILATSGLDHDIKIWSMLGADGEKTRSLPLDFPLLERYPETSRIDYAWKKLDETASMEKEECGSNKLPFNLRDLRVITALNWKMRDEAYPYSIDNNLDNLIFMGRRRGEDHFGGIVISDSDSADSYDSVPDLNNDGPVPGSSDRNIGNSNSHGAQSNRDPSNTSRPGGYRSS